MDSPQFNFGIFALVGVIMLVLSGTSFGYLLVVKNKTAASRMLMWFFLCVMASGAATFLTNLGTNWAHAFAPAQDAFLILGGVFLIRFAYLYPEDDQPREANRAVASYLGMAVFAIGYAVDFALRFLIELPQQLQEARMFYLLTPLAFVLVAGIFFKRFFHWRRHLAVFTAAESSIEGVYSQSGVRLNRHATAALRNFGLAITLGLIPVIVFFLPDSFPDLLASFLFNFGVVVAISAVMLVYLSHTPDPTTVSARLVGISMATVMLILGLAAVWFSLNLPAAELSNVNLAFILLVLLSTTLILLFFPLFFRYTLLLPVDRLLHGIRLANEGDLEARVPLQFEDEIGYLTRNFNRMVSSLNEKSQALINATADLEQQVSERTSALAGANVELQNQITFQRALSRCSRVLLQPASSSAERAVLLNKALAYLMEAVQASRAYILENTVDEQGQECMSILAESVALGVVQHLTKPVNQYFPWASFPQKMYAALYDRKPYGGPVASSFADTPELKEAFLNQVPPLLSLQTFPIHLDERWWGFIGFDDCEAPRQWRADEIQLLRTGAEMIASVLLRWQREDDYQDQALAQQALSHCSQRLTQPVRSVAERQAALSEALGFLVQAARVSRGYLFENVEHPRDGFCMRLVAQTAALDVDAHLGGPFAGHVPWSLIPHETRSNLEQGHPVAGSIEHVMAGSLLIEDVLESDPALSILLFPIFFGDDWWGMIGFDDVEFPRAWGEREIQLVRTGAEILSQTLQRWMAEEKLQITLNALEERVEQRTRQLSQSNVRLLAEIDERRATQDSLKKQLEIEMILAGISEDLMRATSQEQAIKLGLSGMGKIFQPRRVSLALLAERQTFIVTKVYSWQTAGIPASTSEDIQILFDSLEWSIIQLNHHEHVYIEVAQNLPLAAGKDIQVLHAHNLQSLLLVPLVAQNALMGVLICENISASEETLAEMRRLLEVIAGIFSSALAHQQLLSELERKIILRTRDLAALYDLAILGGRSTDLGDILLPMLSRILEITASDAASLHLVEEETLHLAVYLGLSTEQLAQKESIILHTALKEWLTLSGSSAANPSNSRTQPQPADFAIDDFPQLHLVRLHARENVLGVLCCYRRDTTTYHPHEISALVTIGEQLGIIIENHRLRLEAEALAGLRERQRLARELHDSVNQSLYSLTLFARAGQDALEASDLTKLAQNLAEIEESSKSALRAMRLLLYELRADTLSKGLHQALRDRFQMVENRLGIQTELQMDDPLGLDPADEQELFWLLFEALNNAVKHAEARNVSVSLKKTSAGLEVAVSDDGRGFDPGQAPAGFGVNNMRERAGLLGGSLEILSSEGAGTQIRLLVPYQSGKNGDTKWP